MADTNSHHLPKLLLYISLCLLLVQRGQSQPVKQYSFTHYSTSGGLASYETMSVLQDETGYIWIGTNNGLQRFDGSRYITFRKDKNSIHSLPHNVIIQVFIDKKGNLWILTADGKTGIFDTERFIYTEVPVKGLSENVLRAERKLITDEAGHLFMLIFGQAFATLNEEKMEFSPEYNFIPIPKEWKVTSFAQQPGTKKYWIGRSDGLAIYNARSNHFSYSDFNMEEEAVVYSLGDVRSPANIFFDKQGRVWFDAWIGAPRIYAFDLKKKEKVLEFNTSNNLAHNYHEVKGFLEQKNGDIWIKGLGVFARYLEKDKTFERVYNGYTNEQSIYYDRVNAFFEDREENIWIATNNNGIYRFNPAAQFFTNIPHTHRYTGEPGVGSPMSFMYTKQGTLLAGCWGDGIYHYDRNNNLIPVNIRGIAEKNTINAWGMCLSRDSNTIWICCQPGIIAINQNTREARSYNPKLLSDQTIRQIAADRFDNLWLGTQSMGLVKWTAAKGRNNFDEGISQFAGVPIKCQVMKILIDARGLIWVATSAYGVYVIDPSTDKVVMHFGANEPEERKLPWNAVNSLLQYDDTTMVIAANGIHFYNTRLKKITNNIRLPESIPSEITAMERDNSGYLWLSSTAGIFRVNPRNEIWIHFDRVDGIANDRFVYAASYSRPDGTIIFGADNQIVLFDPEEVKINNPSPDITITAFKVMNRDLLVDSLLQQSQINIPPQENSVVIEFSGLRYNGTYVIMYKLEGIDKDWKTADANNQAIYTYLPPGTYTFLVKSEDAEGNEGKRITRLKIVMHPHFWTTWWFYSLLVLLVLIVLYVVDRERVYRLKDVQRMRSAIANNLHQDVTTTLNNINLLGEMAKIKADKDINRSKEYIDQISSKSHNMIIAMDDILWSIDPENDSMDKTLLRIMEFTDALRNRYGASIELTLDKKLRTLKLNMKTRTEFFLIFKEGLRLIVEFAGGKDTVVNIDLFRNRLSLKLQDATARLDTHLEEIEKAIKTINTKSKNINSEADVQYDKNGVAIILLIPVK